MTESEIILDGVDTDLLVPADVREKTLFDWVPISKMFIAEYGRPFSPRKVAHMRAHFEPRAIGMLYLSFRHNTDTYAVIDGQHRMVVSMEKGLRELPCRIYLDLSYEEEALLYNSFATVNKQDAMDRIRARLEAKDPETLALVAVLHRHDMGLALSGPRIGGIRAVHAIEQIVTHYGLTFFEEVVALLSDVWHDRKRAWSAEMLLGVTAFWLRYRTDPVFSRKRLLDVLGLTTPEGVTAQADALKSAGITRRGEQAIGIAILNRYNARLRVGVLPPWVTKYITEEGRAVMRATGTQTLRKIHARRRQAREAATEDLNAAIIELTEAHHE